MIFSKRFPLLVLLVCLLVSVIAAGASLYFLRSPDATATLPTLAVLSTSASVAVIQPTEAEAQPSADSITDPILPSPTALLNPTAVPQPNAVLSPVEPIPDVVVIALDPAASSADQAAFRTSIEAQGGTVTQQIDALNTWVISLPASQPLPASPIVQMSEADYVVQAQEVPTDPLAGEQWALTSLNMPTVWESNSTTTARIAVIDSGIENEHPDLAGRVVLERDFVEGDALAQDDFGHGTAVAGVIAAQHNTMGIAGLAPTTELIDLRVLDARGQGRYTQVAAAIIYAADNGAQIINLSLGGSAASITLQNAIDYALSRGVTVVAAAGNTGSDLLFPANYAPVIAVGSLDADGQVSSFSARGAGVDVYAPGGSILSTTRGADYLTRSGTSLAAPHVAAALALRPGMSFSGGPLSFNPSVVIVPTVTLPPPVTPATPVDDKLAGYVTLEGTLSVLHGDPQPSSLDSSRQITTLTTTAGAVYELQSLESLLAYYGQTVQITGLAEEASDLAAASVEASQAIRVESINSVGASSLDVLGNKRFINLLCRFPNIASTPYQQAHYNALFSDQYPGVNHYFQQISYDQMNLDGTQTMTQWVTLPRNSSAYIQTNNFANLSLLAQDCTAAATATVNFTQYYGINMFFNNDLDCCAWGGGTTLTLDGQTRFWPMTWLPVWSQSYQGTVAHEIGHSIGLPHSTGPANAPPNGFSVYVSEWDVMSRVGGTALVSSSPFYFLGPGTLGYHLNELGWIPAARRVTISSGSLQTVTLDRTNAPETTDRPLLALVPIAGTTNQWYSVEVRDLQGYDQNVPGHAVIINHINRSRNEWAYVVDADPSSSNTNVNDAGAMWLPGEAFVDIDTGIRIAVIAADGAGFQVQISNQAPVDGSPNAPNNLSLTNVTATSFTLYWADASNNEDGFNVYQMVNGSLQLVTSLAANQISHTFTGLTCSTRLDVRVGAYNSISQNLSSTFAAYTLPCPQDEYTGAVNITSLPYTNQVNPYGYTRNTNEAVLNCASLSTSYRTIWYKYQATSARNLVIDTAGSNYDTVLAVFLGSEPFGISNWCNDDLVAGQQTTSRIQFLTQVGQTYLIQVGSYSDNVAPNALMQLNLSFLPLPPSPPQMVPVNGALSSVLRPTLNWAAVSGATGYEIQIDTESSFTNAPTFRTTATRFAAPMDLIFPSYYWRVRTLRNTEVGDFSLPNLLNIAPNPPPAPIRGVVTIAAPNLRWASVTYATMYEVQVSRVPTFTSLIYGFSNITEPTFALPALQDGLYYWRVRGRYTNGTWGPWSVIEPLVVNVGS
jgi:M6 family metalloprotease-like protein